MIGKTNSLGSVINGEKLNISLKTNQSDHTDLIGATVTVKYLDYTIEETWNGNTVVVEIPAYVSYTVSVSDVSGYRTPSEYSGTANVDNSLPLNFLYDTQLLTVNVSGLTSGFTITVGNIGSQTTTSKTYKIPYGTTYTIESSSEEGYDVTNDETITANTSQLTRTITYSLKTYTLTVNVAGLTSGFTVTVTYGSTTKTQSAVSATYTISHGSTWSVKGNDVSDYIVSGNTSGTMTANKTVTITYASASIDLSLLDIYGTTTSLNTANCYVVKEAGTYKFPCVYGNAIKNGATNADAYKNNGGSYSHNFVNYKGNQITSPYIATDTSETISSAQLTIADTDSIFTNVALEGSGANTYVTFEVASVPNTGANGVISIKNSSGTIMWNWHIWVWKDSLATVSITNSTSKTYNILPVNLASKWVSSSSSPTKITNWYYQFGRPTPLAPAITYDSNTIASTYGALSFTTASIASALNLGILNPTTFYKYSSSYNYNWFSTNSGNTYNLWDQACTSTGCSDNTVVKTVYDPCPPGFKMPNGNTFTGFSTSNVVDSFTYGYYFKKNSSDTTGVFFPASGYRSNSSGSLNIVGSDGYVWSAAARSRSSAYDLYFGDGGVYPQDYGNRAYGFSVRPVAES